MEMKVASLFVPTALSWQLELDRDDTRVDLI